MPCEAQVSSRRSVARRRHFYGRPKSPVEAVKNALAQSKSWGMPTLLTEFMGCDAKDAAVNASVGWSYWHYSQYCDTPGSSQCRPGEPCDFGACITGYGAGKANFSCPA